MLTSVAVKRTKPYSDEDRHHELLKNPQEAEHVELEMKGEESTLYTPTLQNKNYFFLVA